MRTKWTIGVIAILAFSQTAWAQEKSMSGDDLKALLANGITLKLGGTGTGYSGDLVLNANGTGDGSAKTDDGKKTFTLKGTWRIKGNQFCRKWADLDKGKEVCETWQMIEPNKAKVLVKGKEVGVNSW